MPGNHSSTSPPGRTVSCHLRLELIFILIISLIKQHVVVVAAIAVGAAVAWVKLLHFRRRLGWNIIIIIHDFYTGQTPTRCQVARRQSIVCSTSVSSSPSSSSSSTSSTASSRNYYLCLHAIFVGLGQIGGTPETWHVHGMKATRSMATFWIYMLPW